ncbi:Hypothetical Protein FCC1311_024952 [Hondaea fermentalgiana]|uniref:Uncharacterized protein n=1 Tax=Hondaea fermentalgiana TaxID=2315210 RepID=A0A2R5GEN4_9STRA|nr:Hypothetical Protein FCC1311_024952 [Hondaea fermentalgiana]|eukprot:GBG26274.1 Hypothetical Protein FCC1311_024952 [Hondaea fermentalgiana]
MSTEMEKMRMVERPEEPVVMATPVDPSQPQHRAPSAPAYANAAPTPVAAPQRFGGDPRLTMRGVPADLQEKGYYEEERYLGPMSLVVCLLGIWCVICVPIDEREVWKGPDGRKIILSTTM